VKECLSKCLAVCTSCNVPPRAFLMSVAETLGEYLKFRNLRFTPAMLCSPSATKRYDEWAAELHHKRRNIGTFSVMYVATTLEYRNARTAVVEFFRKGELAVLKPHDTRLVMHHAASMVAGMNGLPVPRSLYDFLAVRNRFTRGQASAKVPVVKGKSVTVSAPEPVKATDNLGPIGRPSRWDPREDGALRGLLAESAKQDAVQKDREARMTTRRSSLNTNK